MKMPFEGLGQARIHAQKESKPDKELYVVKSPKGGIHYYVTHNKSLIDSTEKIMAHYKNGQVIDIR